MDQALMSAILEPMTPGLLGASVLLIAWVRRRHLPKMKRIGSPGVKRSPR